MKQIALLLALLLLSFTTVAEEAAAESEESFSFLDGKWIDDLDLHLDWDLFDGKGFTPRWAYLDDENFIGDGHYVGVSYFHKAGAESEGVTLRGAFGRRGKKINFAYSNAFSFLAVDIGLSYYFLDDDNRPNLEKEELLGLEMGLRMWVVQIIGVHTENTSFIKLAYGF